MKLAAVLLVAALGLIPAAVYSQIVPPKPGVDMPEAYFDRMAKDRNAFRFEKAWIGKAKRTKKARRAFLSNPRQRGVSFAALPGSVRQEMVIAGTLEVPVIMVKFNNTGGDPYPTSDLQSRLFDGPNATGTMTELYNEMSYGNLTMTGTVYPVSPSGWVQAPQIDTYYEGGTNGLNPCVAKTGELVLLALQTVDPTVDFGIYDNDGADGIPNSGDDDGVVDFVAIVQPEIGGECGTNNMWSHRWVVGGWPEFGAVYDGACRMQQIGNPWTTNDPSARGGFIEIWDYTLQPARGSSNGCGGGVIEIGVFCHEFGHAFGLPDLYDTDGGGQGIGHHGLMGSGNWNSPSNPAHMSAWSKVELGWVVPTVVGAAQTYTVNTVDVNPEVYRLNVRDEKFVRKDLAPLSGGWSMRCGLGAGQAGARNWSGGAGYGNGWSERIQRDFVYNGTGAVTLGYDVSFHTENNFDFGRVKIEVGGTESELVAYTGINVLFGVSIDLTPYLSPRGATSYRIIVEFTSDASVSDEDGINSFDSGPAGPFKIDNISVTGGGESHSADFEANEDGWYYATPPKEFFLVENRSKSGRFDQSLHSAGLYIWHIEQNVARSLFGNTGGTSATFGLKPAGVTVMEADGLWNLLSGFNRGDGGDAFPGSTNNRTFDNTTTPDSKNHNDGSTTVLVRSISDPGAQMTAEMRGGYFAPSVSSITPATGAQNAVVPITDLAGSSFVHGATFLLRGPLASEFPATSAQWVGKTKLTGELLLTGVASGIYDVVIRNPDGQEAVLSGGFSVTDPGPVSIQNFSGAAMGTTVVLSWQITAPDSTQGFKVLRKGPNDPVETVISGPQLIPSTETTYEDADLQPGSAYQYSLGVVLNDASELRSQPIEVKTPAYALELLQNVPNPFNPTTVIGFSLPIETFVSLNIFDVKGRLVATLVSEVRAQGPHQESWDGTSARGGRVASGVYFYQLRANGQVLNKKMMLLR
jgi:M6 family metalloprotease-like protein